VTPDLQDAQKRSDREFRQDLITELTRLKREYVSEYMALHKNARLGVQEDELKKKLMKDPRLAQLNSLAGIEILPKRQLAELQNMFSTNLIPCFTLTEQDLETTPICRYCRFRPLESISDQSVNQLIYQLEDQLETIYQDWILTLCNNLEDPMVKKNLKLLNADDQELIQEFNETKTLPDELSTAFIRALQDVFSGLVKVTISLEELKKILMEKGSPCTVEELQKRFDEYVTSLKKGKDAKKIRVVVE
jgi:succinate dehydrogenase flavin-adding protein (antitoxin of CptAB toxin-antitoxin module)